MLTSYRQPINKDYTTMTLADLQALTGLGRSSLLRRIKLKTLPATAIMSDGTTVSTLEPTPLDAFVLQYFVDNEQASAVKRERAPRSNSN